MIRTLIVDDEVLAIRRLKIKLNRYSDIEIIGHSLDGDQATSMIRELKPDLVLLDINMPGADGLRVAETIIETKTQVIFVTAFHLYAVQAFEREAVDYLLKPVSVDRLDTAIDRLRTRIIERNARDQIGELKSVIAQIRSSSCEEDTNQHRQYYKNGHTSKIRLLDIEWVEAARDYISLHWAKNGHTSHKIRLLDIEWVEAARDYISLHMKSGKTHFIRHTMKDFEKRLDQNLFARVHRSTIVNLSCVSSITHKSGIFELLLHSGNSVRVGRAYEKQTKLGLKSLASSVWEEAF